MFWGFLCKYFEWIGRRLYGFQTMPASREEAYEAYRSYYNGRIAWLSSVEDVPYLLRAARL